MYKIESIGTIYTGFHSNKDAPKQGDFSDKNLSYFILEDEYMEGATDIILGEKLILIFRFDKNITYELKQVPFGKTQKCGVFSTRSPKRPNFLGITEVIINKIEKNKFYFYGADMLNETPLIDIKPALKNCGNINF